MNGIKRTFFVALCSITMGWMPLAYAEDGVLEFWECTLRDGRTMEDAAATNAKWLKLQNDANPGAGIRSWALTSIVADATHFYWMDAFPTLEAWAKSKSVIQTPAGQAIEAEFFSIADCTTNELHQATES